MSLMQAPAAGADGAPRAESSTAKSSPAESPSQSAVLSIESISKAYYMYARPVDRLKRQIFGDGGKRYGKEFWALRDLSLHVGKGETIGLIGRNGSGKSTLLQIIAGVLQPTQGTVRVNGRIAAMLELGSGFNPDYTGRENIFLNGAIIGLSRQEIERRFDEIAAFADIGEFIDRPVKTYSSGMYMRVAFAVATSVNADLLLIDEVLAVGDVFFRQKCYQRLEKLRESGTSIVLVSHAMTEVEQFCRRAILLNHGQVLFAGSATEAVKRYYLLDQEEHPAAIPITAADSGTPVAPAAPVDDFWPPSETALPITGVSQVTNGWAKCTGVWLYDSAGHPSQLFGQGETALVFTEYQVLQDIQVPNAGLVIFNDKGQTVHGKTTLEYGSDVPSAVAAGTRLRFRQEVALELAQGEYTLEVGLSTFNLKDFERRGELPHQVLAGTEKRLCHLANVAQFAVKLRSSGGPVQLLHHGIANLPGRCIVSSTLANSEDVPATGPKIEEETTHPAIFHITHWKAGSQWIYKILADCAPERIVAPAAQNMHVKLGARAGKIYPTCYMTLEEFMAVRRPANSKHFFVLRDLRDTLVSAYFSFKHSHAIESPEMARWRTELQALNQEEGMFYLMEEFLPAVARVQLSWLEADQPFVRYDDLLENAEDILEEVLIDHCGLDVPREKLRAAIVANRFESSAGGRNRGEEDVHSHLRKGIAGDWRNHLSDGAKHAVKVRYGGILIASGYEKGLDW
jgi:lipopolysaccharide transport system ATP-binding protein